MEGTMSNIEQETWDQYNGLMLGPDIERIRKMLVRYDLFRQSLCVPGDIVECGVFKGVGAMYWAKLLAIYAPGSRKRVIGFDTFSEFANSMLDYERRPLKVSPVNRRSLVLIQVKLSQKLRRQV